MKKPKILKLLDLMYDRLGQKNMATSQIAYLYKDVKTEYKENLLDELDFVMMEENKKAKQEEYRNA